MATERDMGQLALRMETAERRASMAELRARDHTIQSGAVDAASIAKLTEANTLIHQLEGQVDVLKRELVTAESAADAKEKEANRWRRELDTWLTAHATAKEYMPHDESELEKELRGQW